MEQIININLFLVITSFGFRFSLPSPLYKPSHQNLGWVFNFDVMERGEETESKNLEEEGNKQKYNRKTEAERGGLYFC